MLRVIGSEVEYRLNASKSRTKSTTIELVSRLADCRRDAITPPTPLPASTQYTLFYSAVMVTDHNVTM